MIDNNNPDNKNFDAYLESAYNSADESSKQFESKLTYICGGLLFLSFTFIEKITKGINGDNFFILIACWITSGTALIINLWSHLIAMNNSIQYQKDLQGSDKNIITPNWEKRTKKMNYINYSTLILVGFSVLLLIIFLASSFPLNKLSSTNTKIDSCQINYNINIGK